MKSTADARSNRAILSPTNSDVGSRGLDFPRLATLDTSVASGSTDNPRRIPASWSPAVGASAGNHTEPIETIFHPNNWETNSEAIAAYRSYDDKIRRFPKFGVYNTLTAIPVGETYSESIHRLARELFPILKGQSAYKPKYEDDKFEYWCRLLDAIARAIWANGCIRVAHGNGDTSLKLLQIVKCAEEAGFLHAHKSPSGSKHESRYIPLSSICCLVSINPKDFAVPTERFVTLFSRETKDQTPQELDFDLTLTVPAKVQRKLELINSVNAGFDITCLLPDPYVRGALVVRRLNATHIARFTDTFDIHGRLYTAGFSHQSIPRTARPTIRFNRESCVELDFGSLHTRMLYHRRGLHAPDDPYALWPNTSKAQRDIAKLVLNTTINAKSRRRAVAACDTAANEYDYKAKRRKYGNELDDALTLSRNVRITGLRFRDVQKVVIQCHWQIADDFGCDMGMTLMRHDSRIALNVLYHFAERGIPCLGVHDSFIVPERHAAELRAVMNRAYCDEMNGFEPVIKAADGRQADALQVVKAA